ncbi:MAG: FMN-binding protein [Dissulfurispiraceae bacterium]|jgi:NosR/NirI family nitrous oxide reductase transcriptional regulator|nr:FMN-binding protein [Dissulfurispiraceae bacterium]
MKQVVFLVVLLATLFSGVLQGDCFVERRFKYKPEDVLKADKFIPKQGYWEGYSGNKLVGYVFLSMQWTSKFVGYSSKPLESLIGMDTNGTITGVKIIAYSEPIFMIGISDPQYNKFLNQYVGKHISTPLTVGREITLDAITGATVTAVVQNATILVSARGVAGVAGMQQAKVHQKSKITGKYVPLTWDEIVNSGGAANINVKNSELGLQGDDVYINLYFGILEPPALGRNILGDKAYKDAMSDLGKDESLIYVFSTIGSFKGVGFAYGGIFSTIEVVQDGKMFIFNTDDYENMPYLMAKGLPSLSESGMFHVRSKDFDPSRPFKLNLILPYYIGAKKVYKTFSAEYKAPERFLR